MGEDAGSQAQVSLDYRRNGPESWIWRFGMINERIEIAEDSGRDWSQLFWQLWKHTYPYAKEREWFKALWDERDSLGKEEMLYALALMSDVAALKGWDYVEENSELTVPGIG